MRETGTISRPFLMLSLISTRSLAFSSGMSTVLMPPRNAASSFSLRPAIGHTRPRSVISGNRNLYPAPAPGDANLRGDQGKGPDDQKPLEGGLPQLEYQIRADRHHSADRARSG